MTTKPSDSDEQTSVQESESAPSETGRGVIIGLLRIRDFRYLFLSVGFLVFGFEMRIMAQSWLALELTDSQAWVGLVNGVPALGVITLSLYGGVIAERYPKKTILAIVRLLLAALAFAIGYLVAAGLIEAWYLLAFALIQGSIVAFGMPAGQSILIEIVGRDRLMSANSFSQSLNSIGSMLGPALGGMVLGLYGVASVYVIVGVLYVLAFAATLLIRNKTIANPKGSNSALQEIAEGFRFVRADSVLRYLMLLNLLALFAGFVMPLIPVYARDILDVGETGFGVLMSAFGVGAIFGTFGLALAGNVKRKALVMTVTPVIFGLGMVVFVFSRSYPLSIASQVLMGAAGPIYVATIMTVTQMRAPDHMRSRVTAMFSLTMQLFPLGWMAGGILAEVFSNEASGVIGALGVGVIPVYLYITSKNFRAIS
jgi:MFS family permease